MVEWLERLLVKQEDLGLIPAQTKCFFSPRVEGGRNRMDPDMINCVIWVSMWTKKKKVQSVN